MNIAKPDETLLTVVNGKFHGLGFSQQSMSDKTDWKINADIQFNEQDMISFFNEVSKPDLSNTKCFITPIVEENQVSRELKTLISI